MVPTCRARSRRKQIGVRAERVGATAETLLVADETDLGAVLAHIEHHNPALIVVDSVQTLASPTSTAAPAASLRSAKWPPSSPVRPRPGVPTMIGQSTRENSIAGPRALEHLVDTVLTFEGEPHTQVGSCAR